MRVSDYPVPPFMHDFEKQGAGQLESQYEDRILAVTARGMLAVHISAPRTREAHCASRVKGGAWVR